MKRSALLFLFIICNSILFAQWPALYNGTGNNMDEVKAMVVDNAGNVYVTGYSLSGANNNDYITIKYNTKRMVLIK